MTVRQVPSGSVEYADSERWRDQDVQRFQTYHEQALNHAYGRNERVAQVLGYLSLIRSTGGLEPVEAVAVPEMPSAPAIDDIKVTRAEFQNYQAPEGMQAAHYLPGQLKIRGQNPSSLVKEFATKVALDRLFADVETLPANFNKADSQAERSGLCRAFAASAETVIRAHHRAKGRIDRSVIDRAYGTWRVEARNAFAAARERKAEKYTMPDVRYNTADPTRFHEITNLAEREAATVYQWAVTVQRDILRWYEEAFGRPPRALGGDELLALERSFRN